MKFIFLYSSKIIFVLLFFSGCSQNLTLKQLNNKKIKTLYGKYDGQVFCAKIRHVKLNGRHTMYLKIDNKNEVILPVQYRYNGTKPIYNKRREVLCYFEIEKSGTPLEIYDIMFKKYDDNNRPPISFERYEFSIQFIIIGEREGLENSLNQLDEIEKKMLQDIDLEQSK